MLKINLKNTKVYHCKHQELEVEIHPLSKTEQEKLKQKYTKKDNTYTHSKQRSVFNLPEIDQLGYDTEYACLTWQKWTIQDEHNKPIPCDRKNIQLLFDNYYDEYVDPIIADFEKQKIVTDEIEEKEAAEKRKN